MDSLKMLYCCSCSKPLLEAAAGSKIRIPCKRCGAMNTIELKPERQTFSNKKPEVVKSARA